MFRNFSIKKKKTEDLHVHTPFRPILSGVTEYYNSQPTTILAYSRVAHHMCTSSATFVMIKDSSTTLVKGIQPY